MYPQTMHNLNWTNERSKVMRPAKGIKPVQVEITGVLREDSPEVEEIARKLFPGDHEMTNQNETRDSDPETLAAARKGAGLEDARPIDPSELVGQAVYAIADGVPREIGIVLDYTSDSVVVGVSQK